MENFGFNNKGKSFLVVFFWFLFIILCNKLSFIDVRLFVVISKFWVVMVLDD